MNENLPSSNIFHIGREAVGSGATKFAAARLAEEVAATYGPRDEEPFALVARNEAGGWIGGINGVIHWRWLYIGQFFLIPEWRGRGLGRALLDEAEHLARESAAVGMYLDTFDPGATYFYRKCGFITAGRIENFPPGAARTFLCKRLAEQEPRRASA
jgi:GNAT superfamily N-acetyltransferase